MVMDEDRTIPGEVVEVAEGAVDDFLEGVEVAVEVERGIKYQSPIIVRFLSPLE